MGVGKSGSMAISISFIRYDCPALYARVIPANRNGVYACHNYSCEEQSFRH